MDRIHTLVLSGGALLGACHVGALQALLDRHPKFWDQIDTVAGSSIGALIGMLLCVGYTLPELRTIVQRFSYHDCAELDLSNFWSNLGLDTGQKLLAQMNQWVVDKLGEASEALTFQQLFELSGRTFWVTVCPVGDAAQYWSHHTHPEQRVVDAVRISMAIPLIFASPKCEGRRWVDGAVVDSFPISRFTPGTALGLKIESFSSPSAGEGEGEGAGEGEGEDKGDDSFDQHLTGIMDSIAHQSRSSVYYQRHQPWTVLLRPPADFHRFDLGLSDAERLQLVSSGYQCMIEWLRRPHFPYQPTDHLISQVVEEWVDAPDSELRQITAQIVEVLQKHGRFLP